MVNAVGVVVVNTRHSKCAPVTGGVILTTATVPVMKDRKVRGAIVVVEAIVAGFG